MWVFLCIKYSKFWSVLLEHFIERKPLISEEWNPSGLLRMSYFAPTQRWWRYYFDYLVTYYFIYISTNACNCFSIYSYVTTLCHYLPKNFSNTSGSGVFSFKIYFKNEANIVPKNSITTFILDCAFGEF